MHTHNCQGRYWNQSGTEMQGNTTHETYREHYYITLCKLFFTIGKYNGTWQILIDEIAQCFLQTNNTISGIHSKRDFKLSHDLAIIVQIVIIIAIIHYTSNRLTNWPPFYRLHFEMHILELILLSFDTNFDEIFFSGYWFGAEQATQVRWIMFKWNIVV